MLCGHKKRVRRKHSKWAWRKSVEEMNTYDHVGQLCIVETFSN